MFFFLLSLHHRLFFFYLNPPANVTCSLEINTIQNVSNHCFKSGNKVPSRRWFSSPFFCLLNIYANANCLSFDFIEHTLVPKQKSNEINISIFFNHGNEVPSRRWFSSPFFCLFNIYANANCLSFDFIERTLMPKQKLNEINVSAFFNHGNKALSRRWFSSPFFCLLNICANANWLSFDFIERTLVPKQKLNEKNVGVFFNHGNKELSRRWFSPPFFCL